MDYSSKRKFQRFESPSPVRVEVLDDASPIKLVMATTRDVSAGGVFILSPNRPPLGTKVRVTARLPSSGIVLEDEGLVVRIEKDGFAVHFDSAANLSTTG